MMAMMAPMFGTKLAANTSDRPQDGERHAEHEQEHEREHRGEQPELGAHDEVASQVGSEPLHGEQERVLPTERRNRPRAERRPACERVDHGEGEHEHRATGLGDGGRHRLDQSEDLLRRDDRSDGAEIDADPEPLEEIAEGREVSAQAALVRGNLDRELAHRECGDAGPNETDGKDDHDRRRQCEAMPDPTPLERGDHRPGGEGDEETEHHRDDERSHLAEGEHRD